MTDLGQNGVMIVRYRLKQDNQNGINYEYEVFIIYIINFNYI